MEKEEQTKPEPLPHERVRYFYFLDNVKIESETSSISGSSIRAHLPSEKAGYAIFLESQGNEPDRQVQDSDNFSLEKKPLRFYSVPPANFGAQ